MNEPMFHNMSVRELLHFGNTAQINRVIRHKIEHGEKATHSPIEEEYETTAAYDNGYENGYETGHDDGFESGHEQGVNEFKIALKEFISRRERLHLASATLDDLKEWTDKVDL